jgi:succinyl-CoA synthetase beta subunit
VNIHEYQAKEILRALGVPIPAGEIARTADEAQAIAARIGEPLVVKAQVHAGGRGKAGGVKLAKDPAEARDKANAILGMQIKGLTVEKVLVTEAADIASEAYVGIIMDRAMASRLTRRCGLGSSCTAISRKLDPQQRSCSSSTSGSSRAAARWPRSTRWW